MPDYQYEWSIYNLPRAQLVNTKQLELYRTLLSPHPARNSTADLQIVSGTTKGISIVLSIKKISQFLNALLISLLSLQRKHKL